MKPRPARTLVLYLNVGHLTIGLSGPATGRGATVLAFLILFVLRRCFLIGWLNHVLTLLCQSLWKCPLGTILFRLRAMVAARYQTIDWLNNNWFNHVFTIKIIKLANCLATKSILLLEKMYQNNNILSTTIFSSLIINSSAKSGNCAYFLSNARFITLMLKLCSISTTSYRGHIFI